MVLFDFVTELETDFPAANPASPLRLLAIGKYLQLDPGRKVIDFGCGRGEMLCLWAKAFGTTGVGVDLDEEFLADGASRVARWSISDRVSFVCQDVKAYDVASSHFDLAMCMGASMGFGGFASTIRHLKRVIGAGGSIVVSESFYTTDQVPSELREYEGEYGTEQELFDIARREGLEIGYYARATRDEWDRYIFGSRREEMRQLQAAPFGPAKEERKAKLHRWQDMYLRYRQPWQEMAFMTLHPV